MTATEPNQISVVSTATRTRRGPRKAAMLSSVVRNNLRSRSAQRAQIRAAGFRNTLDQSQESFPVPTDQEQRS